MKQEERSVQFHIQCAPGDVGRYCILPGDPGRSEIIARYFDNPIHVASREYAPIEFPAVPDYEVLSALVDTAKALGHPWHAGVVQCKDSFYGQHAPGRMPVSYELEAKWEAWKRLGVLASEMESAALFTAAAALGVRCGSAFHVIWNQEREKAGLDQKESEDVTLSVKLAVEAVKELIRRDRAKEGRA